jgi:hypothetical protein
MPTRTSKTGSELFIIDNSDADWKVRKYLHDWCQLSSQIDIATLTATRRAQQMPLPASNVSFLWSKQL